ncbi:MAG: hypothetical protein FWH12_07320 [Treponema sp.]|nr:hypothetical protein [Treponema sp.]
MKNFFIYVLLITLSVSVYAQRTYYVSAAGSNSNDGLSDITSFQTLNHAFIMATSTDIKTITVIGTLNILSEGQISSRSVFSFTHRNDRDTEILITGIPGATGNNRAVLSGIGSGNNVVDTFGNIRFEHIEISGAEGQNGFGIVMTATSELIIGTGTVIRGNSTGVQIHSNTCILDGGEIRDNNGSGVAVVASTFTMRNGIIRNNHGGGVRITVDGNFTMSGGSITGNGNRNMQAGGGVFVSNGRFNQTGGSITNNTAGLAGGGVAVRSGATFVQTGGSISNNTAQQSPNVFRERGALGSDLGR